MEMNSLLLESEFCHIIVIMHHLLPDYCCISKPLSDMKYHQDIAPFLKHICQLLLRHQISKDLWLVFLYLVPQHSYRAIHILCMQKVIFSDPSLLLHPVHDMKYHQDHGDQNMHPVHVLIPTVCKYKLVSLKLASLPPHPVKKLNFSYSHRAYSGLSCHS